MDDKRALKEIKRFKDGKFELISDLVAREVSFTIFINKNRLVSIACLPENLPELALGFLFSEGLVFDFQEIIDCQYIQEELWINFELDIPKNRINSFHQTGEKTSGCGSGLSSSLAGSRLHFPKVCINAENILDSMKEFLKNSELFQQTGGVHRAGLLKDNIIEYSVDDIGRHNAVDKVAGMAINGKISLKDHFLLCSGRISSEIVKKAVRLDIPVIISHSAPTSEAIRLGWKFKVYLIGFARGRRFNIYTGFEENLFEN